MSSPGGTKAVLLLSGGLGSYIAALKAKESGLDLHALTFNYGQVNVGELEAAGKIGNKIGVSDHALVGVSLKYLSHSPLTGHGAVPLDRSEEQIAAEGISRNYVPGRMLIFLSMAAAYAESIGAGGVIIGADAQTGNFYPDCRGEFFQYAAGCLASGTRAALHGRSIRISVPLIGLQREDVIRAGLEVGADFSLPVSCYQSLPEKEDCGRCDACVWRKSAFQSAGVADPRAPRTIVTSDGNIRTPGGIALPGATASSVRGKLIIPGHRPAR